MQAYLERGDYAWNSGASSWDNLVEMEGSVCTSHANWASCWQQGQDDSGGLSTQRTSQNALLNGNSYHTPDYSQASGLHVIDFTEHWNFTTAEEAWRIAKPSNDKYYNDASWNVVYVDSHDYAPDHAPQEKRFSGSQDTWAENLSLMFTHRGIPCVYYGSEVEFQKGKLIDQGTNIALQESGRAYFGGYIKGDIHTTDFAEYNSATGNMAVSLSHPLAQHIQRLSLIRMAVPALRKGQYSVEGCSGSFAFKRRYTDATTDSYALVCISGNGTFTYREVIKEDNQPKPGPVHTLTLSNSPQPVDYTFNKPWLMNNGSDGEEKTYVLSNADGSPITIQATSDHRVARYASALDVGNFFAAYDTIPANIVSNELMYAWNGALGTEGEFVLPDGGAYVPFPWNIREVFGKGRVRVHAVFDGVPYDGSIVNMGVKNADGSVCYIIGVRKSIRQALRKGDGDTIHVVITERK